MEMPEPQDPPLEIAAFLDRLHAHGQRIVPGSLIWLPHPTTLGSTRRGTKPGRLVAAVMVMVEAIEATERKEQ